MAQLKKARGQAHSTAPSVEAEASETSSPSKELTPIRSSNHDSEEPKKKKNKKSAYKLEVAEENDTAPILIEDDDDQQLERPGKKTRKRKVVENEGATNESCSATSGVDQNCKELPLSKKKVKKHNKETELLNGHGPTEDQNVESEVGQKKKKKQRKQVDDVVKEEKEQLVGKKSKKDKKKKKKHQE